MKPKGCFLFMVVVLMVLTLTSSFDLPAQNKRLGKHTVSEWHRIIDSTWGPGLPTATKLEIFDFFWNAIDQQYGGFPYLDVNWDSLKAIYRPQVEAGVSRGRFSAIMGKLSFSLQDMHAYIADGGVNGVDGARPSYAYGPGAPLFWPVVTGACGVFGAALTPLPDSSLLVYRAMNANPLGLLPGDVILGYDRVPWKRLYKEILAAEFPLGWALWGTTTRSITHYLLTSAGINWGLFDTIDVAKYGSGDTVHLPTAPLKGLPWQGLWANEQLPVPGVRMPDFSANEPLTYGMIEGTSIGYVYCPAWNVAQANPFRAALSDLLLAKKVTGLILDCRLLGGGDTELSPDAGFDLLFSENPAGASRWRHAMRIPGKDHFAFTRSDPFDASQVMQPDYYDRPIAVLTGPATVSMGDMHSFRLRFHPMVRFFGLPTNGGFCVPSRFYNNIFSGVPVWGSWFYQMPRGQMESLVNNEGFLMHKGFPVDEEVWLTRDGVARGEDDVVKRAIEWITTASHAHTLRLTQVSRDTVSITAHVENPLSHSLAVTVTLRDDLGGVLDSLTLTSEGAAGDSLWGARHVPRVDGTLHASIRTENQTEGTSRTFRDIEHLLFTRGPVITTDSRMWNFGKVDRTVPHCDTTFFVKNIGYAEDSLSVSVTEDSSVEVSPKVFTLATGDSQGVTFTVHPPLLPPGVYSAQVFVKSHRSFGQPSFTKLMRLEVVTGVEEEEPLSRAFALGQNYPNPFNPTTTIRYALPQRSHVTLTVYNTLGQQVATLVNSDMDAGYHAVQFDASDLASGIYFYRLQAGNFLQTKKLCLVK